MPLYIRGEDISLMRQIAREFIGRVVAEEVVYYKFSLADSVVNRYGECKEKFFYPGVVLTLLIDREDQITEDTEYGPDTTQQTEFQFLRDDLVDLNLVPEKGDIIMYRNIYFEVHNIVENQYESGKYPEYALSDATQNFGSSWSILCQCHQTRTTKLNITKDRL